eukprot:1143822-Rhodomonas_salina.3
MPIVIPSFALPLPLSPILCIADFTILSTTDTADASAEQRAVVRGRPALLGATSTARSHACPSLTCGSARPPASRCSRRGPGERVERTSGRRDVTRRRRRRSTKQGMNMWPRKQ